LFSSNSDLYIWFSPVGPVLTLCSDAGDEILSVNGVVMQGLTHRKASNVFKSIREGLVICYVARRVQETTAHRQSCEELELL